MIQDKADVKHVKCGLITKVQDLKMVQMQQKILQDGGVFVAICELDKNQETVCIKKN